MSNKYYKVIEILDEKDEINTETGETIRKYHILWSDKSTSWEPKENLTPYCLETYNIIKQHNKNVDTKLESNPSQYLNHLTAFVYNRSSVSNESAHNFSSIDVQRGETLGYLLNNNIKLKYYAYDNGVSGRNFKNFKHELGYWYKYLVPNKHIMVVSSIDRLGRNTSKCIKFVEESAANNIPIYFVREKIMYHKNISRSDKHTVETAFVDATNESDMISERQKELNKVKRSKGYQFGPAKFGYKIEYTSNGIRKKVKCNEEQQVIKEIFRLSKTIKDCRSDWAKRRIIADSLNSKNMKRRGKNWNERKIQTIFKNQFSTEHLSDGLSSLLINQ